MLIKSLRKSFLRDASCSKPGQTLTACTFMSTALHGCGGASKKASSSSFHFISCKTPFALIAFVGSALPCWLYGSWQVLVFLLLLYARGGDGCYALGRLFRAQTKFPLTPSVSSSEGSRGKSDNLRNKAFQEPRCGYCIMFRWAHV